MVGRKSASSSKQLRIMSALICAARSAERITSFMLRSTAFPLSAMPLAKPRLMYSPSWAITVEGEWMPKKLFTLFTRPVHRFLMPSPTAFAAPVMPSHSPLTRFLPTSTNFENRFRSQSSALPKKFFTLSQFFTSKVMTTAPAATTAAMSRPCGPSDAASAASFAPTVARMPPSPPMVAASPASLVPIVVRSPPSLTTPPSVAASVPLSFLPAVASIGPTVSSTVFPKSLPIKSSTAAMPLVRACPQSPPTAAVIMLYTSVMTSVAPSRTTSPKALAMFCAACGNLVCTFCQTSWNPFWIGFQFRAMA